MNKQFHIFEEDLSESKAQGVISRAECLPPMEAKFDGKLVDKVRVSELRWIYRHDQRFTDIYNFVRDKFFEANRYFNVDFIQDKFPLQFTTYYGNSNGHYDWHQDVRWPTQSTGFDRKLSFILQLSNSDEYEGGDLEFQHVKDWNPKEFRKMGKMLVFPSVMYHRVTPVTSGVRRSLVGWVEGPPWR
jgi:PKHD-type hydroxylase